jgi:hypothetical protein
VSNHCSSLSILNSIDGMACSEFIVQFSRLLLVSYLNMCILGLPLLLDTGLVLTTHIGTQG